MKGIVKQGLISLKNIVRVTAFVLVVAVLLDIWAVWFKKKSYDGSLMMQNFYGQPENSIDLLCIGSSHAFIDINTMNTAYLHMCSAVHCSRSGILTTIFRKR